MENELSLSQLQRYIELFRKPWEGYALLPYMDRAKQWLIEQRPNPSDHVLVRLAHKIQCRTLASLWELYCDRLHSALHGRKELPDIPDGLVDQVKFVCDNLHMKYCGPLRLFDLAAVRDKCAEAPATMRDPKL
jgi:hypothetical protein